MDAVRLSARLSAVVGHVPFGAMAADVGCDHGLVSAHLLRSGRAERVIASDLRKKPLAKAAENFKKLGIAGRAELRLCDGLDGISKEECDTVIVAGMGGDTIADLLARAPWTADGAHLLILQPMTAAERLRAFLSENGYAELDETVVLDGGRLYAVVVARGGGCEPRGQEYLYFGRPLLRHFGENERAYLRQQITRLRRALAGAEASSKPADRARAEKLREALGGLLEIEKEMGL